MASPDYDKSFRGGFWRIKIMKFEMVLKYLYCFMPHTTLFSNRKDRASGI